MSEGESPAIRGCDDVLERCERLVRVAVAVDGDLGWVFSTAAHRASVAVARG